MRGEKQLLLCDDFVEDQEPIEDESDLEHLLVTELSEAIIQSTDWTTGTIIDQINKERIQLNPKFQRRDAWTDERKSKFIESLLLGFPIPQLVLAEFEKQRGRYVIIDGKQRLLSIIQFVAATDEESFRRLRLTGLDILAQLNGKTLEEIRQGVGATGLEEFENRTIRTVVIRHWKHEAVLYHIFLRLNTGNVQLSPQELRNALHPGPFAEFVDKYSGESRSLRLLLQTNKPDFRMRDAELLLRYYAFRNFLGRYAGSIKSFLDYTTNVFNENWDEYKDEVMLQAEQFEIAVGLAYSVFGSHDAFRKWKGGNFIGRFNRAVYDVILYHFYKPDLWDDIRAHSAKIKDAFIQLSQSNADFTDSLESTTKSLSATVTRLALWTSALDAVIDKKLRTPCLIDNRIRF